MSQYSPLNNPGSEALAALFDEWLLGLTPAERDTAHKMVDHLVRSPIRNLGEKSAKELIVISLSHPAVRRQIEVMRRKNL